MRRTVVVWLLAGGTLALIGIGVAAAFVKPTTYDVTNVFHDRENAGIVWVQELGSNGDPQLWPLNADGGILYPATGRPHRLVAQASDCVGNTCFRIVPGRIAVERSTDTGVTYTPDWQVGGADYATLVTAYGSPADLVSRSVVVVPGSAGLVVFVADGRDGVAFRDAGGRWHRLGAPQGGEGVFFEVPASLTAQPAHALVWPWVVGGALLLYAVAAAVYATRQRLSLRRVVIGAVALAAVTGAITRVPSAGMFPAAVYQCAMLGIVAPMTVIYLLTTGVTCGASRDRGSRDQRDGIGEFRR